MGRFLEQYIWIKYWVIVLQPLCSVWSEEAPCLPGRCHRVGGDVGPLAPPCPTNSQPCSGWDKRDSVSRVRVFHVTMYAYGESITCGRITVCHTRILVFHYDVWYYFTERKKINSFYLGNTHLLIPLSLTPVVSMIPWCLIIWYYWYNGFFLKFAHLHEIQFIFEQQFCLIIRSTAEFIS